MNKKLLALIIVILLLTIVYANETIILEEIGISKASINALQPKSEYEILLKSRQFIPNKGIREVVKNRIIGNTPKKTHVLIQLDHIPNEEEIKSLGRNDIELLSYIPDKAWFASIPSEEPEKIASLHGITMIDSILPEDKISPSIQEYGVSQWAKNPDGTVNLTVMFFKDVSLDEAAELISTKYDGEVIGKSLLINALLIVIPENLISDIADEDIVQWVEEIKPEPREFNDGVRAAIDVTTVQASPYNLDGSNVIAGEWDGGWVDTTHDDLAGRVTIGDSGSSTGAHATHVAGTMLGNGTLSQSKGGTYLQWKGMATRATVISYEWWDNIVELENEFNSAINTYGIDLSTNSWGIGPSYPLTVEKCNAILGNYFTENAALDDIIQGYFDKAIPIMWAAGNDRSTYYSASQCGGYCYCGGLGFTYGTITPYGTSKNTITVGATNSNDDSMTSFSSWGPVDDGRLKPDIVAPGCQVGGDAGVTSTVPTDSYDSYCGTSMATPAVSGSVALIIQDYKNTHSNNKPLPSTVKAIIIHAAKDLGNTGPDYRYGYGRINVTSAINLIESDNSNNDVILESEISEQGGKDLFTLSVSSGQSELKITLVWDDYPGTPNAVKELVNDLDLVVIAPNGTKYYPWVLDPDNPSNPATTGIDNINNVEQIYVENPITGAWRMEVIGTILPYPNQKYSIVSSNNLDITQYGYLESYLTDPISNKNVTQNKFFTFSSVVKCVGGSCGDVNATLDPEIELYYDDGSAEGYLRYSDSPGGGLAVRFTPPSYPIKIKTTRFYVYNTKSFELHVWDDNGIGGTPKSNLITPFQVTPSSAGWFNIDLSSYNITIDNGDFYIGWIETWSTTGPPLTRYNSLGYDTNTPHNVRSWVYDRSSWASLSDYSPTYATYDLMVRAVVETPTVKGAISTTVGATPFYTTSNNPQTCYNMQAEDMCNQTWQINATGNINSSYNFFVIYNSNYDIPINKTDKVNITIVKAALEFVSITLFGYPIDLGNLDYGTTNNPALGNNQYKIRVDKETTVNIDLYQKGNDFTDSSILGISNMSWYNESNVGLAIPMKKIYENPIATNIISNTNVSSYYWINIPSGQKAGDYTSTIYIKAIETGNMP